MSESLREQSAVWHYGVAVCGAVVATVLRILLDPLLGDHSPYVISLLVIVFIAWNGGLGPALICLLLSALTSAYLFVPPRNSLMIAGVSNQLGFGLYCFVGVGCALLGEFQRAAQSQAEDNLLALTEKGQALEGEMRQRRIVEDELRRSEVSFRMVAELVPQLVWQTRADGNADYFNQRWYVYTGQTREESLGFGWKSVVHADDRERTLRRWEQSLRAGDPYEIEYRLRGKDGRFRWFLGRAQAHRDAEGRIVFWFGTCTDIDDAKRHEQELRQSEARFRLLSDEIPEIVWTAEPSGAVVYYNRRWYAYTGLTPAQTQGDNWQEVIHAADRAEGMRVWQAALRGGDRFEVEQRLRRGSDGAYRWHLVRGRALHDEHGAITQWIGTVADIDDQRRRKDLLERLVRERTVELAASNDALERSNRELDQFAAIASHDLQEPLRKIQSFGDRLQSHCAGQLDEQGRDHVGRMMAAAHRMSQLIDDLLKFSRVTTKTRALVPVDLSRVAAEVCSDLEGRVHQTGGHIEIGPLPTIDADPMQMRQLLQNLIGNGLKFHRPGVPPHVQVQGRVVAATDASMADHCELTVADNGIGFDEAFVGRIFEVFQRLHGRREYDGTGVGLAICRKIVERHGGHITARSTPGQGSTFVVKLPVAQQATQLTAAGTPRDALPVHTLSGRGPA